ncbi:MAG: hypothetical protein GIKADHBN_02718 [Phycisphaerales bacterium]|nr:hypothetical protein [Phycisphaerales bacterium]
MSIRSLLAVALAFTGSVLSVAAQPGHAPKGHAASSTSAQIQPGKPINDRCPIQGEEVDPETPVRVWRRHTIGFCCPGCDTKWDAKPDAEKDAFVAKYAGAEVSASIGVARKFQAAMARGDLAALNTLFLADGRATVLENGADEGTWEAYRDGHLAAEIKELAGYRWETKVETESRYGATSVVHQVGGFSAGPDSARRSFSAAITFVVVDDAGTPKIAHMHWSSRETAAAPK